MTKKLAIVLGVLALVGYASLIIKKVSAQTDTANAGQSATKGVRSFGNPYNILFIPVDDLNHWIGVLGRNNQVKTPNIDKLAKSGVLFSSAHCAAPICCPSRAALLSGKRPSSTGVYGNSNDWRTVIPEQETMPTFFRTKGYEVLGGGKIYHGGFDRDTEFDFYYRGGKDGGGGVNEKGSFGGVRWGVMKGGDDDLKDYHVAEWAVGELSKKHDKPFFLSPGIFRPHMPWNVPQKYYDLFPLETIQLPPYKKDDLDDMPEEGRKMALSLGDWKALMETANPELEWKKAIRAYMACIAYADAMIGKIIDALDKSEYKNNTIVVLWGDHGWHLNEKNHWRKFSLWEEATRAPLIFRVPGVTQAGTECRTPVDFMSIYPTLSKLCGFSVPKHVEGISIVPLLQNVNAVWNVPAVTTHGFNNHAVRTKKYRYISYAGGGEELYDEEKDPYEWNNIANATGSKEIIKELRKYLPKTNKPEIARSKSGGD
jgi:arylsulfatase A-like enzyme